MFAGADKDDTLHASVHPIQFEPLLMPKLQLPRLQKSLLPREHLLELLDTGLERKLTLIAGPAGYGKTTLVGQWVASRTTHPDAPRVACVTLDEGDNDPISFWRYLIAACQKIYPGFGKEALELLLAHRLPPFKSLDMMLTALLNELSRLEYPGVLMLDDFHVIVSPQVTETLSFFLEHLPTSFHLIILIRGAPLLSLTRLRARNELLDIYPPLLSFSLAETRAFFEQEFPFTPPPNILRQIHEHIDGWPTGLRLLVREIHWSGNSNEIELMLTAFAGSHRSIQDYFLSEVLHRLPTSLQEFLLQTSALPRVTAALCDAIMERTDSSTQIEVLHGGDLFLIPLDGTGEWSRYHSLFAEAMQQEAHRRLGDVLLHQIAIRASIWYEQHGLPAEAIETALNAAEWTRASNLIKQFIENKEQSQSPTIPESYSLYRWMGRLPQAKLEHVPDLCLHYALSILFISMEGSSLSNWNERIYHLLQVAEQQWRDANNTAKLAEVFAFRAFLARQEGRMLQAVTWAKQSLAWLPLQERTWRNLSLTVVGIGEILDGNLRNAHDRFMEALELSEQQGNSVYARATRGMLSWVSFEQGELHRTAEQFRQMQVEAREQEDLDDIAHTQLGLAQLNYQWNNLQDAAEAVQEALVISERKNVEELQAKAALNMALIEQALGQTSQAQQRLIAWLTRFHISQSPHSYQLSREVQATLIGIQLATGNLVAVERWFANIERDEKAWPLPRVQQRREQLLYVRLLISQGEISIAIEKLESLHTAVLQTGHLYFALEVQIVLVMAYSRQGSHAKARKQLFELLVTARSENYVRLFLNEGEELANILHEHLHQLHDKALLTYVKYILSAFTPEIAISASDTTSVAILPSEPLSSQEMNVLRLLAAGRSNADIAREFVVSVNTVRTQIQSIYRKLRVNNRVEASAVANRLKLI